jgi:HK97 family phage portal protein
MFGFKKKEVRECPKDDNVASGSNSLFSLLAADYSSLNISTFYRGVVLISNTIAQMPLYVKKIDSKGQSNIIRNHVAALLFNDPKNEVDKTTMIRCIIQNVICKGNAFVYIKRGEDGKTPTKLVYLESGDVSIVYDKPTRRLLYQVSNLEGVYTVKPENMLHFKLFTWDGVTGKSVICFANKALELTKETNSEAAEFFKSGMNQVEGILKVNSSLSKLQREQIHNAWQNNLSGGKRDGLVVLQGNMDYQSLGLSPEDSQLLESRDFNQADVCQFLNISPAQLNLKGFEKFTTFEDANAELLQRTLMPYIAMIENELSNKLLGEDNSKLKIILDTAALLRPTKQSEANYYGTMIDKGILTRNEVRQILGFNKLDGLDEIIIPYTEISQNTVGNKDTKKEDDEK